MSRSDTAASTSGELLIRRFAADDASAVRALHDLAPNTVGAHAGRGPWDHDIDSIKATYLDDGGEFLVGLCDGRLVAMGALRHVTDAVAEIKRMRVPPAFERRGFGRLILTRLENRARELGYQQLRLDTTVIQTSAQRLYRSAGYRQVGRGQLAGFEVIYFEKSLQ